VGAAAIASGLVLGLLANDRHDTAAHDPGQLSAQQAQSDAESLAVGANVSFAAGGLLTVAALIWGIADGREDSGPERHAAKAPRGASVRVGFSSVALRWEF
jgi:hypothetical protein